MNMELRFDLEARAAEAERLRRRTKELQLDLKKSGGGSGSGGGGGKGSPGARPPGGRFKRERWVGCPTSSSFTWRMFHFFACNLPAFGRDYIENLKIWTRFSTSSPLALPSLLVLHVTSCLYSLRPVTGLDWRSRNGAVASHCMLTFVCSLTL